LNDLATRAERDLATPGLSIFGLAYGRDGVLYIVGTSSDAGPTGNAGGRRDIYAVNGGAPKQLTDSPRIKTFIGATSTHLVYNDSGMVKVSNLATGAVQQFAG